MGDLVDWYNATETEGAMSPVELAALSHYRFIRIHPFEDGNGRIVRLLINCILARHGRPMVVVRNRNKNAYLDALHDADIDVGPSPSAGANAALAQIRRFLKHFKAMVTERLQYNIGFATEHSANVWWYDAQKITFRSASGSTMLTVMQQTPDITIEQLSKKAGFVTAAVKKQLAQMIRKGYIERREKDGDWQVFVSSSV